MLFIWLTYDSSIDEMQLRLENSREETKIFNSFRVSRKMSSNSDLKVELDYKEIGSSIQIRISGKQLHESTILS